MLPVAIQFNHKQIHIHVVKIEWPRLTNHIVTLPTLTICCSDIMPSTTLETEQFPFTSSNL